MTTRKASFRLLAVIICLTFAGLLASACGDPEPSPVEPPPVAQYLWPPGLQAVLHSNGHDDRPVHGRTH